MRTIKCPPNILFFREKFCRGDVAPPKPEFGAEFRDTNFGRPNFGQEAPRKIHPQEIHLPIFTFQNSTQKWGKTFTLYLCRAILANNFLKLIIRKRGGVQKSMGNQVPWKIGILVYLPVTSRSIHFQQKEALLSPCNFATAHLTACILNLYRPLTSRPMKWRTLSQRPKLELDITVTLL